MKLMTGLSKLCLATIFAVSAGLGVAQAATVKDLGHIVLATGSPPAPTINAMILGYGTNPIYDTFVTFGRDLAGAPATTFKIGNNLCDGVSISDRIKNVKVMKLGWIDQGVGNVMLGGVGKKAKGTMTVLGSIGDTAEYSASPTTKVQVSILDGDNGADLATTIKTMARAAG